MALFRWLIAAALGFFMVAPAHAGDVYLYRNSTEVPASQITTLVSTLTSLGAVVDTTTSTVWPTSYTGYKLVILLGPASGFSASQVSALESFVDGGGRLVVSGDYEFSIFGSAAVNNNVNNLLSSLGVGISLNSEIIDSFLAALSGVCSNASSITSDSITDGVSQVWLIASNSLTLTGSASSLIDEATKPILAVDQPSSVSASRDPYDVIVSADYDLLTDYCDGLLPGDNIIFWENLYEPFVSTGGCDDDDGDGFEDSACGGDDCDDSDGDINPDADEVCNSVDDDCDSTVDEDATDAVTWYDDGDSDGFGDPSDSSTVCSSPSGHVSNDDDCDDTDGDINPDADEVCNDTDDDCDSAVDEDATDFVTWYDDGDSDGFGDPGDPADACDQPAGYVDNDGDCDDSDGDINPDADEVCNSTDDDCDSAVDEDAADFVTWYDDGDSDGFGDPGDPIDACDQPAGYVSDSTDCDDSDGDINPDADEVCNSTDDDCDTDIDEDATDAVTWYDDGDSDGFGDPSDSSTVCSSPSGHVSNDDDCDDTDGDINPDADEVCNDTDDDCDSAVDEDATDFVTWYDDGDSDGFGDATDTADACEPPSGYVSDNTDCDDGDDDIYPGADETCNDEDDDCDTAIDEDATDWLVWYADDDGDDYGDPGVTTEDCTQPFAYIDNDDDCDDSDSSINPDADEVCNSTDDDCDTDIDEDATDAVTWYDDGDADGFGDAGDTTDACSAPADHVSNDDDCDDSDGDINPDADEVCNSVDDDCDSTVDEDATDFVTWYDDGDSDGFGDASDSTDACSAPGGFVSDSSDCDDTDGDVFPGADETCNEVDDDCDSTVDEHATDVLSWYHDGDADGYGDPGDTTDACDAPTDFVSASTDCDDTDADVFPGADEYCNGIDDDCDADIDEDGAVDVLPWYADTDEDGFGDIDNTTHTCDVPDGYTDDAEDCDDGDSAVYPGADETCNEVDDDCDGAVDEEAIDFVTFYDDSDSDGFGDPDDATDACDAPADHVSNAEDCDDTNDAIFPDADEVCNSLDDDCDTTVDEGATDLGVWYADADEDLYGDPGDTTESCSEPEGYVANDDDCADDDASINPEADEICDAIDQDCDDAVDEDPTGAPSWYADDDGDGYGDAGDITEACETPDGSVGDATDCDDTDPAIYPGADEVPYDAVDQDCDGADLTDVDGDGYDADVVGGDDCADRDAAINPGAAEVADGVDEDCDVIVDEGTDWYDDDGDGFAESGGDCDDGDALINPAVDPELCDEIDDDCDDEIDEGTECFDDDGDGYTELDGDCNDADIDIGPDATELPDNGIDDDCDGVIDVGLYDGDGDGYAPAGGDCDDQDGGVNPGASEIFDGVDQDCDELVDEGTPFYDDDGDGFTEDEGDCDDGEHAVNPDAAESPDGVDEDCDDVVDEGTEVADDDGDGFSEVGGDCDDDNPEIYPGATELENNADDDCDGEVDNDVGDLDGDGWTEGDGDCDDADGWVNPGVPEMCDEVDNNCDGVVDEDCVDEGATELEKTCGCGTAGSGGPGGPGALLWLMPLLAMGWRRRAVAAVAVVALGSGCRQDFDVKQLPTELTMSPELSDLGTVGTGVPYTLQVQLTALNGNVAIEALQLEHTESADPDGESGEWFSIADAEITIPANEIHYLEVSYFADTPGYHHAVLTVISDADEPPPPVELRAHAEAGAASLSPTALEFGPLAAGEIAVQEVLLSNDGPVALTLESVQIPEPFSLAESLPQTVSVGAALALEVSFSPDDDAAAVGVMTLDLGGVATVPEVSLRGNDCEGGLPEAYDLDGDGWTACSGDCDDSDPAVNDGGNESADGVDEDCDAVIDEGTAAYDDDGDGFSENDGDCNDSDADIGPDAAEVPDNGIDDDCDGLADTGTEDLDGDGYTAAGGDCNDSDADTRPGGVEVSDGADDDCDGVVDEGTEGYDDDGDGFAEYQGDCDDSDPDVRPGATELADWIDNDCDGELDEGTVNADDDGDGYSESGGDCDDGDEAINPAAWEISGDGIDNDCDGDAD